MTMILLTGFEPFHNSSLTYLKKLLIAFSILCDFT